MAGCAVQSTPSACRSATGSPEEPPFLTAFDTVDWAFRTADRHGIGVLLDLHGVPGSQNGWDHSGRQGSSRHTSKQNIDHSLRILADLAARCKPYDNLIGIELLNEPPGTYRSTSSRGSTRKPIIACASRSARSRGRRHPRRLPPGRVEGLHAAGRIMRTLFSIRIPINASPTTIASGTSTVRSSFALLERRKQLDGMKQTAPLPGGRVVVLPPESLGGRKGFELDVAMRAYGDAQLINFDATRGWFFWTYKTEEGGAWSFRDCVHRGWLPELYNG